MLAGCDARDGVGVHPAITAWDPNPETADVLLWGKEGGDKAGETGSQSIRMTTKMISVSTLMMLERSTDLSSTIPATRASPMAR